MKFRDLINKKDVEELSQITTIDEAQFNEKNIEKVVLLYSKILGRKLGGTFKPIGFETYSRQMGPGKGFRTMNDTGAMLRFNWDAKLAKASQYDLTSMDYWAPDNTNFEKPSRTVTFSPELNVVQVLEQIALALKTGKIEEAQEHIANANLVLTEAPSADEKREWLASKGMSKSLAGSLPAMKKKAGEMGLAAELEVFLGQKETNSFEGELKEADKKLSKQVFSDPETVFEDIEDLLSVVASKKWRTLIVCGQGGIGKTYHITEGPRSLSALLGPEGKKWTYHSGAKAAPFSFYKTLFQERDKVIVFDEADSLLKNDDIVMMLKPILDTSGSNMAEYMSGTMNMVGKSHDEIESYSMWVDSQLEIGTPLGTGKDDLKLPSKFQFGGGMIFISNMRANQIEKAIMSRSIFIDVYLAQQDVLKRIKSIGYAQSKKTGVSKAEIDEILESLGASSGGPEVEVNYMTPEYARKSKEVTVRAMQLAIILKKSGLSRWSSLAAMYA